MNRAQFDDEHELYQWRESLQATLASLCGPMERITVFRATDSTQDAARRMRASAGDVVVAGRQTSGRGRLGRRWADTADEGIAATFALDRGRQPERLAIAAAVATAQTAEVFLERAVSIKWPNDVLVDDRKLAGILIEQVDDVALLGIGMNVHQTAWPDELAARAVSLQQLGAAIDRLDVLQTLLERVNAALVLGEGELVSEFAARDVLTGRKARFHALGRDFSADVLRIDPLRGLLVRENCHELWLPGATTSLRME